ncbi:hypothetical protein ColKHC_13503 [Colletotrichum higginsianum]|nr:hypothetical protein ColKHC_13503 [Colletotrichum higginsianum]
MTEEHYGHGTLLLGKTSGVTLGDLFDQAPTFQKDGLLKLASNQDRAGFEQCSCDICTPAFRVRFVSTIIGIQSDLKTRPPVMS